MKTKNMLFMVLGFVVVIMALPAAMAAEPPEVSYNDIAIVDYCHYEYTDFGGNEGIAVNVTIENKGNLPIIYPRIDTFQNDAFFTYEKYGDLIHGSAIYHRTMAPGEKITDYAFFFPFYAYYEGSDRGQEIYARIYADWPNELDEVNEKNNFVNFSLFVEPGAKKKCIDNNETNVTINKTKDFHSKLLIEKDIEKYHYTGSYKYKEDYGIRHQAGYELKENGKKKYTTAEVIVFENKEKANAYLKQKIKNAKDANYEIKNFNEKGVYYINSKPYDKTFMWVYGNYVIAVSSYHDEAPTALMLAYLEKYPTKAIREFKEIANDLNIAK